jgi:hypothetical protein
MSSLVLSPAYVHDTPSCKKTELEICSAGNGACHLTPLHNYKSQASDRYINTDYIIASVLKGLGVRKVVISYDIACKWSIHHLQRISDNHPDLNVDDLEFSYLVPKFHLPAHGASCQTEYSFNYTKGVGRTHGETIEQGWANVNLAALATREMGPGARHLTLDDIWSGWNWRKILGMGNHFSRAMLGFPADAPLRRSVSSKSIESCPRERQALLGE